MNARNIEVIRGKLAAFEAAYNREDLETLLSIWGPDFVDMPDGLATLRGAEAHARRRETINARFREFESVLRIEPGEIVPLGDAAVLVFGRLTVALRHRQTDARSQMHKRFMEVWMLGPVGWAIQYEIGNNEPPAYRPNF